MYLQQTFFSWGCDLHLALNVPDACKVVDDILDTPCDGGPWMMNLILKLSNYHPSSLYHIDKSIIDSAIDSHSVSELQIK